MTLSFGDWRQCIRQSADPRAFTCGAHIGWWKYRLRASLVGFAQTPLRCWHVSTSYLADRSTLQRRQLWMPCQAALRDEDAEVLHKKQRSPKPAFATRQPAVVLRACAAVKPPCCTAVKGTGFLMILRFFSFSLSLPPAASLGASVSMGAAPAVQHTAALVSQHNTMCTLLSGRRMSASGKSTTKARAPALDQPRHRCQACLIHKTIVHSSGNFLRSGKAGAGRKPVRASQSGATPRTGLAVGAGGRHSVGRGRRRGYLLRFLLVGRRAGDHNQAVDVVVNGHLRAKGAETKAVVSSGAH